VTGNGFVTAIKPPFSKVRAVSLKDYPALDEFFGKRFLYSWQGGCAKYTLLNMCQFNRATV